MKKTYSEYAEAALLGTRLKLSLYLLAGVELMAVNLHGEKLRLPALLALRLMLSGKK